jgi:tetratricopeptide (TPR) repeat protein
MSAILLALVFLQEAELREHHRNLGKAYYERGEYALAVEELEKVLVLDSASGRDYFNAGMAYLQNRQEDRALAAFATARQMEPGLIEVDFGLGVLQKRAQRYPLALEALERVAARDPLDPCTWFNIGAVAFSMGRVEDAERAFRRVIDLGHGRAQNFYVSALFRTASIVSRRGAMPEAQRLFAEFETLRAATPNVALTETALENGRYGRVESYPSPGPPAPAPEGPVELVAVGEIETSACAPTFALGDFDSDGAIDLFVASPCGESKLFRNAGDGLFADSGLAGLGASRGALFLDYENSGFPALYVLGIEGHALYRNEGGRFRSVKLPSVSEPLHAVALDFDNDSQIDLALADVDRVQILRNDGDGTFRTAVASDLAGASGLVAADFDEDGFADLFVPTAVGAQLLRNVGGGALEKTGAPRGGTAPFVSDFDRDGWLDVVVGRDFLKNRRGRLEPFLSISEIVLTPFGFDFLTPSDVLSSRGETRPLRVPAPISERALAADLDGDGTLELIHGGEDGKIRVLREKRDGSRFVRIALEGKRSNRQGIGAVVELKAGRFYRKAVYPGHPVTLDTGDRERLDVVRVTWPNGVIQNALDVPTGALVRIEEDDRQTSSCPFLYLWNGERFELLTDVLGRAPLGEVLPDGSVLAPHPEDYVRIPPGRLIPKNGRFAFQVTEELRELAALDRVALLAVDRPREVEVYVDERFSSPPFAPFRLYPIAKRIPAAFESAPVERHRVSGFAEEHALELRVPQEGGRLWLFLSGWVYWPGSSSMRALSDRTDFAPMPPRLEVKNEAGDWVTAIEDVGLPSGIGRTLVVDLSGVSLGPDRVVRIVTNFAVYWSEPFFGIPSDVSTLETRTLLPSGADLHFRGFSAVTRSAGEPERYDYERLLPEAPWNAAPGLYTRYGDVEPLVRDRDRRLVVMAPGDELTLAFDPEELPPVPEEFERDFVLHFTGYAKDQDPNTRFSRTVGPLPAEELPPGQARRVPPLVTPLWGLSSFSGRAHQPVGKPGCEPGEEAEKHDSHHHQEHEGKRSLEDYGEGHVRSDSVDDVEVQSHRRSDEADLHVHREHHREPVRVEAGGGDDGKEDGGSHQDHRHRREE